MHVVVFKTVFLFLLCVIVNAHCNPFKYDISPLSETFNTHYLIHGFISNDTVEDSVYSIPFHLHDGFVIELGALRNGERACVVYNDSMNIVVGKNEGKYVINDVAFENVLDGEKKISLYFIGNQVYFYVDEILMDSLNVRYDLLKHFGIRLKKEYSYTFFNCYYPEPFHVVDYGELLEKNNPKNSVIKFQNVGETYSVTFPVDVVNKSQKSIRFEYRYSDSKKMFMSKMRRGRSEIAGVHASSPMNKWIIEFDLYLPISMKSDSLYSDCISQLHESSLLEGLSPGFSLRIKNENLFLKLLGYDEKIGPREKIKRNKLRTRYKNLGPLSKGVWHHIKVYVREAYSEMMMPLTVVWVDGKMVAYENAPNCYNYLSKKKGFYNYIKFGIYKWDWLIKKPIPGTEERVYYFDNYSVKY